MAVAPSVQTASLTRTSSASSVFCASSNATSASASSLSAAVSFSGAVFAFFALSASCFLRAVSMLASSCEERDGENFFSVFLCQTTHFVKIFLVCGGLRQLERRRSQRRIQLRRSRCEKKKKKKKKLIRHHQEWNIEESTVAQIRHGVGGGALERRRGADGVGVERKGRRLFLLAGLA
jgi:hypothetical protein